MGIWQLWNSASLDATIIEDATRAFYGPVQMKLNKLDISFESPTMEKLNQCLKMGVKSNEDRDQFYRGQKEMEDPVL